MVWILKKGCITSNFYTITIAALAKFRCIYLNFSCMFLNPNIFSSLNSNCSNLLDVRNLQEQVKKAFCYQKLFRPFTVWIYLFYLTSESKKLTLNAVVYHYCVECQFFRLRRYLNIFANSWLSAWKLKSFSRSLERFFLTVGQNNFGNKIPYL